VVSEIEGEGRGIPVLLRHYVRLNARLLAFNVDADFNHALDGLMTVDLLAVEPRLLEHYMGKEGAARFRSAHSTPAQ
jgi:hypothetical protein